MVVLQVPLRQGQSSRIRVLRDETWVQAQGAKLGQCIWVERPEMSVMDQARVIAVSTIRYEDLPAGTGRLVTGTFEHTHGLLYELTTLGAGRTLQTLCVTPQHPLWSEDRNGWISVSHLREGERLSGKQGLAEVVSVRATKRIETVYNIEVDGDHCYRVGEQGLLVHNASSDVFLTIKNIFDPKTPYVLIDLKVDLKTYATSCTITIVPSAEFVEGSSEGQGSNHPVQRLHCCGLQPARRGQLRTFSRCRNWRKYTRRKAPTARVLLRSFCDKLFTLLR